LGRGGSTTKRQGEKATEDSGKGAQEGFGKYAERRQKRGPGGGGGRKVTKKDRNEAYTKRFVGKRLQKKKNRLTSWKRIDRKGEGTEKGESEEPVPP